MTSSRERLCRALDWTGLIEGVLRLRGRFGSPYLTVLTYHRVFDPPPNYPYDQGVCDVGPEAFDVHLSVLSSYFNVVDIEAVCAHFRGEDTLPPNAALITFDDGYLDNLRVAAPLLKKHGMTGVFFIATSYIEKRRLYWWDRIHYLLNEADPSLSRVELSYPTKLSLDLEVGRNRAIATLLQLLKIHFALDVERLLSELAAALGVPWSEEKEASLAEGFVMTWDQVRELHAMGMDVQSHTRSHRPLQTVPLAELESELAGSKKDLETQLGIEVKSISYPIGRPIAKLGSIRTALEAAGYEIGFTNASGPHSLLGTQDRFDICRMAVEPDYRGAFFRGVVALPQLGY